MIDILCKVIAALPYHIVFNCVVVPDFYFQDGISHDGAVEGVVPMWVFASILAGRRPMHLSSEVDFAEGVLREVWFTMRPKASVSWVRLASMGLMATCIQSKIKQTIISKEHMEVI